MTTPLITTQFAGATQLRTAKDILRKPEMVLINRQGASGTSKLLASQGGTQVQQVHSLAAGSRVRDHPCFHFRR